MDKKMYYVVVMENSDGDRQSIMTCDKEKFHREHIDLERQGYHIISHVGTSNKAFYCKTRCKIRVQELKDLEEKRMEHMIRLEESGADEQIIKDTENLYEELEATAVELVGMAYSRFLRANEDGNFEYNDELAIACYNLRESRMGVNNQLMKSTYTGWDC